MFKFNQIPTLFEAGVAHPLALKQNKRTHMPTTNIGIRGDSFEDISQFVYVHRSIKDISKLINFACCANEIMCKSILKKRERERERR